MRLVFIALLLITWSSTVRADCASGPSYDTYVGDPAPESVSISIDDVTTCGGSAQMLRQNIDTGEVVQLAAYCDPYGAFIDECVPAGRYRYGLATPLACETHGCGGTPFFGVADVTSGSAGCTLSTGDAGPTPYTGAVPWTAPTGSGATEMIELVCAGAGGCNTGGALSVHVIDLLALCGAIAWSVRRRRGR